MFVRRSTLDEMRNERNAAHNEAIALRSQLKEVQFDRDCMAEALDDIAAMETPGAAPAAKRMATRARTALGSC